LWRWILLSGGKECEGPLEQIRKEGVENASKRVFLVLKN
jgi:hypothetical protein